MAQESNKSVIWSIVACVLVLIVALGGYLMVNSINNKVADANAKIDNAVNSVNGAVTALQNTPQASIDVPTAAEIAAEIDMPETVYSVQSTKKNLAISLASDEFNTRDFKSDLVSVLNARSNIDGLERKDIQSVAIRDTETSTSFFGSSATVNFVVKVVFNDYGDDETARVKVQCHVTDLVYDDDYENADVDYCTVGSVISTSLD